jgi:hypothetical protein
MFWLNRLLRVEMILRDVLYLSYRVPAGAVRTFVPEALSLATIGEDGAFISVVLLKCCHVHATYFPLPRFNYEQINIRTYVKDPETGKQAIYFIRSAVTSPVVMALTKTIGLPWELAKLNLAVSRFPETQASTYSAAGDWQGKISLKVEEFSPLPSGMPPFPGPREAMEFLIQPLTGFFSQQDRLKGFHIRHPELTSQMARLREFTFPLVTDLGLVEGANLRNPHSVLYVPEAKFYIYLPARSVESKVSKES